MNLRNLLRRRKHLEFRQVLAIRPLRRERHPHLVWFEETYCRPMSFFSLARPECALVPAKVLTREGTCFGLVPVFCQRPLVVEFTVWFARAPSWGSRAKGGRDSHEVSEE